MISLIGVKNLKKDLTFCNSAAFNESALQEVGYDNVILYFDGRSKHNR